ncbi:DUF1257 domain-containing protein [uncultured Methanoregula sp.]|uniref:DUF1257 domain-containing protein n=1 Tax=uncultured Methanoregula sp. TaxID=1005933 RepID=UPI002AAC1068|nr:DUF1257 domain-containing protein [uncultured Methanoregula sp.]
MSHYSRVKTAFHNRKALVACLIKLGYQVETDTVIKGHHGEHTVDIAAKNRQGYGIGFVKGQDGSYDMVADWWGVSGTDEQKILQDLSRQAESIQKEYARKMILEQTAREGYELVSETNEEDGSVRIVVRRWE